VHLLLWWWWWRRRRRYPVFFLHVHIRLDSGWVTVLQAWFFHLHSKEAWLLFSKRGWGGGVFLAISSAKNRLGFLQFRGRTPSAIIYTQAYSPRWGGFFSTWMFIQNWC
jgi:hypothetical protein